MMRIFCLLWIAIIASGQDFDGYLRKESAAKRFSGAALVAREGKVIFAKGYGMANLEHDIPNKPETKFRIGSITKQFAAAAILKLEEAGKLKVDDPICQYIEDCPKTWSALTIHHLLSHTSGIPNFTNDPEYPKTWMLPSRPRETMRRFRDRPLDFEPGKQWKYSNSGYILLAAIIEKSSGMKYEDYLRQAIFDPLGMADSGSDAWSPIIKNRASGYTLLGKAWGNAPYHDMTIPLGGGDLYSTVLDLIKWDQALYGTGLLSEASKKKIFTPVLRDYGYGWIISKWEGRQRYEHGGGINGFSSMIQRYPEDRTLIIVLGNTDFLNSGAIANNLGRLAYGLPVTSIEDRKEITLSPDKMKEYVGVYQLAGAPAKLEVRIEGDKLVSQLTGQGPVGIFPEGPDKFFLKIVDAQLEFQREGGAVASLVILQNGQRIPARKVPSDSTPKTN